MTATSLHSDIEEVAATSPDSLTPLEDVPEHTAPQTSWLRYTLAGLVTVVAVGIGALLLAGPHQDPVPSAVNPSTPTSVPPVEAPVSPPAVQAKPESSPTPPPVSAPPTAEPPAVVEPALTYDAVEQVIGFTPDSGRLTRQGRAELDAVIATIPEGTTVDVYGYVYAGVPGTTFTLDTVRAQTVAKYLTRHGIDVGIVKGLGKKQRGVVVAWMQQAGTP